MPRAENRKRPANQSGNPWGEGLRNKPSSIQNAPGSQDSQEKRQQLLEKMRKIQESKTANLNPDGEPQQ